MARKSKVKENIKKLIRTMPRKPGVYQFRDASEGVLYVGKAKDLRARVSSYFQRSANLDPRKARMVELVRGLSFIVTSGELEALALEANLIKQYRPRFNVVLRDDKNYPYLKLTRDEYWPRLEVVRRTKKDKALYFGPYIPAGNMWETLGFIRRHFGLRPCSYKMDESTKMRPCLQHQMGRCTAPCAGLIPREDYMKIVVEVEMFLKGRRADLLEGLRDKMARLSKEMRYEEAAHVRDHIKALERAWESQKVVAPELGDLDVIAIYQEGQEGEEAVAVAQLFFVRQGTLIGSKDFLLRDIGGVSENELMAGVLKIFYAKDIEVPPEVLLSVSPDDAETIASWLSERGRKVRIKVPLRGKKRELMQMALENARTGYESRKGGMQETERIVEELAGRLGLDAPPMSIGAFDVSNISGSDPVGAYVHWEEGEFLKDRYRHLRIKSVAGVDDYAMMRESVLRVLSDMDRMPDLVVIDGGKGHLEAALTIAREFKKRPPLVGLAKKPDRVFMEGADEP
ncbi:MAG: excinuclease ABC subunit UvrC, partial [Thermodesulfovibrionales bacterium]|nr:excinuclease ABC subunit UvrC [Thermodesulfovibrionales bacterium]